MKKQMAVALGLVLLIPIVMMAGGLALSLINPEIAAGHPNYVRNYHLLSTLRIAAWMASIVVVAILWLLACFLVIRSKERSAWWLIFAALGPIGFAILVRLNDRVSGGMDRYERFVRSMNRFVRVGYEVLVFVMIWELAFQAMVLKRDLMIRYESYTTGVSTAQIIDTQNASSGMWAFGEGMEVMYLVVLIYLIWPVVFNVVGRGAAMMPASKAR
jgi:hypothetical protein